MAESCGNDCGATLTSVPTIFVRGARDTFFTKKILKSNLS
jgi:hypothetical protein